VEGLKDVETQISYDEKIQINILANNHHDQNDSNLVFNLTFLSSPHTKRPLFFFSPERNYHGEV